MAIAAMFAVACSKDDDNKKDDPKPDDPPTPEYTGPVEGTSEWSVVGTLLESNWGSGAHGDYVCAESDGVFVLKNVKLVATDEFKFRQNKAWDNAYKGVFASLGAAFDVDNEPGGDNIKPGLDGIYDLYLNVASAQAAIVAKDGAAPSWKPAGPVAAAITIDGDFADWAALKAGTFSQTYGDEDATHPALTHCKVYADAEKVYVYVEWDMEFIEDTAWVPFHCYINTDGNEATGGYADQFSDACSDILLEGAVYADNEICSYWSGGYPWIGEANASGWGWAPDTDNVFPDDSPTEGAGVDGKYEFSIDRQMFAAVGFPFADVFSIGFDIQQNWSSVGILPNAAPTEDNAAGVVASLKVTTQK